MNVIIYIDTTGLKIAEYLGGIMASDEKHICAMCGYPGAKHSGGYRKPNGTTGEEWFCSENHFNLWLKWKTAFSPVSAQKRIFQYKETA